MNICTIICGNYMAQARVIAKSLRLHYPEAACVVLVVDGDAADADGESFRVLTLRDLDLPDRDIMAGIYEPIELSTAVKPWLLEWMLAEYGAEGPIAYFDPDIEFFSRMPELEAMLERHWLVMTPHLTAPMPLDAESPSEQAILLAGTYNLGFVAMSTSPLAANLLEWWRARLARSCLVAPEEGFFVDQRYMDFVPGLFDGVGILRHDGYNVAYWNLATRALGLDGDQVMVNGAPLRFFHFSGFDPRRPEDISKHQTRVDMNRDPALAMLYREYAGHLVEAGFLEACTRPYGFACSARGRRLTPEVRSIYRDMVEAGFELSLFDVEGDDAFAAAVNRPDGPHAGLPHGLALLWSGDPDLRARFPDVGHADRAPFLAWCGRQSVGATLLGGYVDTPDRGSAGVRRRPEGVNVVGYLHAESGVGEAARSAVSVLDAAALRVWPVALHADGSRNAHPFRVPGGRVDLPFAETLLCVNADMVPAEGARLVRAGLRDTRVTGFWWWETEDLPARFESAFAWVDRVVCGSSFVADAVRRRSPVPVSWFPLPVEVGDVAPEIPGDLSWPDGFVFYFAFDYASVFRRKNPLGLAEAYRRAFGEAEGAALVIKSVNADRFPEDRNLLRQATQGRSDIRLIDDVVSADVRNAMTAACGCYVSLHRSEGFGLTIAEAMYLGRPVIATGYSANMDFMTPDNSLVVPYRRIAVGPGAEPYEAASEWADPDLDAAAAAMRRVFDDRSYADSIGAAGARSIRQTHSTATAAQVLRGILAGDDV